MRLSKAFAVAGIALSSILTLINLGCSGGGGAGGSSSYAPKGEPTHIMKAGLHVTKYIADNNGKVPKDTAEMKEWAAKNNIPEDELVSTRDKEHYQVHQLGKGQMKEMMIVEATGEKGKKFMWVRRPGAGSPVGTEWTQEQIDNEIKPSGIGKKGRP
jgi:hypothetical protein